MDKIEEAAATTAYRPGSRDNYHRNLTAASFNAPTIAVAPTPKPEIPTTTLWMNRLDDTLTEQHIHRLVDRLAPVDPWNGLKTSAASFGRMRLSRSSHHMLTWLSNT